MEHYDVIENNKPLFRELKHLGCEFDPKEARFNIPEAKKPNVSEVINFYEAKSKGLTPFQKKLKKYLESNLPLDIYVKKTDKGVFLVDENDLLTKKQIKELLDKIGAKIQRTMNTTRYLINTENSTGKL